MLNPAFNFYSPHSISASPFCLAISYDLGVTVIMDKIDELQEDASKTLDQQIHLLTDIERGITSFTILSSMAKESSTNKERMKAYLNEIQGHMTKLDPKMKLLLKTRLPIYNSQFQRYKKLNLSVGELIGHIDLVVRRMKHMPMVQAILKSAFPIDNEWARSEKQEVLQGFDWKNGWNA